MGIGKAEEAKAEETNIGLLIAVIGIVIALIGVQLFTMSQIIVAIDRSTDQISREIKDARDLVIWSYATGAKSTPTPMPTHTPTPIETPITPEPTQTPVTPLPTETTPGSG